MEKPLVSVAAINYNNAKWVIDTLDSIKAQTYENLELIVVDDCSTDNSPFLIEEWLKSYEKPFKFIKHEKNLGVCATGKDGQINATGKYFTNIATDDKMSSNRIQKFVERFEQLDDSYGAVYCDAGLIGEDGELLYGNFIQRYKPLTTVVPDGLILENLLESNFIPAMSVMLRTEIFKEIGFYDTDLNYEDHDYWIRIAEKYKFKFISENLVQYRIRSSSMIHVSKNELLFTMRLLAKHSENHPQILKQYLKNIYLANYFSNNDALKLAIELNKKYQNVQVTKLLSFFALPLPRLLKNLYYSKIAKPDFLV